jgi:hypothetical protein
MRSYDKINYYINYYESHMTTGIPAGQEFIDAWGRSRVPSRLEHSAGPARYILGVHDS